MPIEVTDRRTRATSFSTGTPAQPAVDADHVLVKPLTTYMEGSEHKGPHSEPYRVPRHHANELKGHGIAAIIEPQKPAPGSPESEEDHEVERPDDASRAPHQDQVTASTVPAHPGAEGRRPEAGIVPPAATSEPSQPSRRRGRPTARRS